MNGQGEHGTFEASGAEQFRSVVAEDLLALAALHARPLEPDVIMALWRDCYHGLLGLQLHSAELRQAVNLLCMGLTDIPTCLDKNALDALSTAHRQIYTDDRLGARPFESVWCDSGNSDQQESVGKIAEWQRRFDFTPRESFEHGPDHLVSELQFLAHLASNESGPAPLAELVHFLDQHLLRWVDRFALRVCECSQARWYQGLAALTAAYLNELRAVITRCEGVERQEIEGQNQGVAQGLKGAIPPGSAHAVGRPHAEFAGSTARAIGF